MSTSPVPRSYPLANQLHHVVNAQPVIPYTNRNSFVSKICNILTKVFQSAKIALQYTKIALQFTKIVLQCTYEVMHANSSFVISALLGLAAAVATLVALALTIYSGILYINREASNPIIAVATLIVSVVGSLLAIASTAYDYKLLTKREANISATITSAIIASMVAMAAFTSWHYKLSTNREESR